MENTIQRPAWRLNFSSFAPWLIALPDSKLRLIVLAISAILVGTGWFFTGTTPWFPVIIALSTVYSTPRIKDACLKTNKWLVLFSVLVLSTTLVIFPLIPRLALGVVIIAGNLPLSLSMVPEMQAQVNKLMGIKPSPSVKPKPAKAIKTKPPTNTYRKWLTKHAKKK